MAPLPPSGRSRPPTAIGNNRRHDADPEVIHRRIQSVGLCRTRQFPTVTSEQEQIPELSVQPAAEYRAPGVFVKGFGIVVGTDCGNEPYCGVGGTAIPAVLVPSIQVQSLCATIDHDVCNVSGHHTLVIPQRAALILRARPMQHRNLELVVQRFGRGEGERTVFRNRQRIAQNVLQNKTAVR